LSSFQRNDPDLGFYFETLNDEPKTDSPFQLKDNILYYLDAEGPKLVIPASLKTVILQSHHDDPLCGHFGSRKTINLISRRYYWKTLAKDVAEYCRLCQLCQKNKPMRRKIVADLKPIQVTGPFDRVAVDCMGPMKITQNGNRFIVVFVDYFTKYVEAFSTPDIKASTIAELFVTKIVCRHGAPSILQSDRGTDFTSQLMSEITKLFATRQLFTTPYHPMANGEVERSNQTLITRIRMYVNQYHTDWDDHLPYAVFATNIHQNETTKFSPFELMFGRLPTLPIDSVLHFRPPMHLIDLESYHH